MISFYEFNEIIIKEGVLDNFKAKNAKKAQAKLNPANLNQVQKPSISAPAPAAAPSLPSAAPAAPASPSMKNPKTEILTSFKDLTTAEEPNRLKKTKEKAVGYDPNDKSDSFDIRQVDQMMHMNLCLRSITYQEMVKWAVEQLGLPYSVPDGPFYITYGSKISPGKTETDVEDLRGKAEFMVRNKDHIKDIIEKTHELLTGEPKPGKTGQIEFYICQRLKKQFELERNGGKQADRDFIRSCFTALDYMNYIFSKSISGKTMDKSLLAKTLNNLNTKYGKNSVDISISVKAVEVLMNAANELDVFEKIPTPDGEKILVNGFSKMNPEAATGTSDDGSEDSGLLSMKPKRRLGESKENDWEEMVECLDFWGF